MTNIRIATRVSPLALWQAEHVAALLRGQHVGLEVELVPMRTTGDKLLDAPLAKVGGKGLFVKELEVAMLEGRADIAVHSMKDVPVELPDELHLPVVMARADPRDALVSVRFASLDSLPSGARVGTSSLRRRCQLANLRPDLRLDNIRGGVDTRLRKLEEGEFDALVLAVSGLARGGHAEWITEALAPETMLPAIGQGALGIECRRGDSEIEMLIAPLIDATTHACVVAERALNRRLEGGCQVPIAGFAERDVDELRLRARVISLDGVQVVEGEDTAPIDQATKLGEGLAATLLDRGAGAILEEVYALAGDG